MPGEQSWPTQPFPTKPPPLRRGSRSRVDDISPYLPADEAEAFTQRLLAADNKGIFTPISYNDTVHIPTSNGGALFGGTAAEPRTGAVYVVAHDNPGILRLLQPGESGRARRAAAVPPGQVVYQQNCQACHGRRSARTESGVPALVHATADPANNIAAGAPRFDAAAIRTVIATGKGRMPAFPHLTAADVDALVAFLTAPPGGRGRGRPGGSGAAAAPVGLGRAARADRRIGLGVDAARSAGGGRGRGALPPYPDGVARLRAPGHQRVQHGRQPHRAAVHVDREVRPERAGASSGAIRLRRRSGAGRARHHRHGHARHCSTA